MPTKTAQVRAAIADCDRWYAARSRNIRTLTESINAFWIEIDYHITRMELAEANSMEECADFHIQHILRFLARIQTHAAQVRGQHIGDR